MVSPVADIRPSLAWSGPCDVIVRRHPKGGYLFDIMGSGAYSTLAHGLYSMAKHYASEEKPKAPVSADDRLADPLLTREQSERLVHVLRESKLLVDDRALKVDARMSQWSSVLLVLIVGGGIAGAYFSEHVEGVWSLLSTVLLLLIGALVGGWLRSQWEQDPASIPSPWALPIGAVMIVGALFAFVGYMQAMTWVQAHTGRWGFLVWMIAALLMASAYVGILQLVQVIKVKIAGRTAAKS